MRRRLACVLLLVSLSGCTVARKPPKVTPQIVIVHTLSEAISRYDEQCLPRDRLHAQTTIEYRSGETKRSFNAALYIDTINHKVRLRADAYFIAIFDMSFESDQFSVLVPSMKTLYKGQGDNFRGFALQDLSEALSPRLLPTTGGQILLEEDQRSVVLTEMVQSESGEYRPNQKIFLTRPDLLLVRRSLYYPTGMLKSDLTYSRPRLFQIGTFPSRVSLTRPWQNISVILNLEKLDSPTFFNSGMFIIEIPPKTKTVDLESNMSEDILFRTSDGSNK